MWIVTREVNSYDQYGEYFVCAFTEKPTEAQLYTVIETCGYRSPANIAKHLLAGGGRREFEDEWFYMKEYKDGEALYDE